MTAETPKPRRKPTIVQTLLRSLTVQNHSLNAIGVQPADVVIEPDVTGFDLTEFMRAKELAAIANRAKPGLLILYHQLFWGTSEEDLIKELASDYAGKVVSAHDLDVY